MPYSFGSCIPKRLRMRSANDSLGKAGYQPRNETALADLLCHRNRLIMEMQHGETMILGRELQAVTHT